MSRRLFQFEVENQWDYENGFYLTSHKTRLFKMIAHYELYKRIINLPGHIVECGVYKGASIIRFATFRDILENPYSRKIIGFDMFGKFPRSGDKNDIEFVNNFESAGGFGIPKTELEKVFSHKEFSNYEFIEGDISSTIPDYIKTHPELKISLLHIDVDIFEPSKIILENLYERVVKDGLIVLDDYSIVPGATRAIDEFFIGMRIEKLSISHVPSFIIK